MYFCKFEQEYLPAIAELEEKAYPPEMLEGLHGFQVDMERRNLGKYSVAGFSKGELVCYIAAFCDTNFSSEKEKCIYISDVNCRNPRYLKRLLLKFFAGVEAECGGMGVSFCAHMRDSSHRLLENKSKRKDRGISVLEERYLPRFYWNEEDAWEVRFTVDYKLSLKDNWKAELQLWIDQIHYYWGVDPLERAFAWLHEHDLDYVDLHEEKNMRFVLNSLKEVIVDYYAMYSEKIPIVIKKEFVVRVPKTKRLGIEMYAKTIKTYQSYGFQQNTGENHYYYNKYSRRLYIIQKGEAFNTQYPEQLSGVRWVWRHQMKYLAEDSKIVAVKYYNRYGVGHDIIKVPYLTKNYYLYLVDKMYFIRQMRKELEEKDVPEDEIQCFRNMCSRIYHLLSGTDARKCISSIAVRRKEDNINYFHDWNLIVCSLIEARDFLTKGAVKSILMKSYNQALKISKGMKSMSMSIKQGEKMKTALDIKTIRKEFSSLIRRDKDYIAYINALSYEVERKYRAKLKLPASQEGKVLDFVDRMKRYNPHITFYDAFQNFGAATLKKFINGTYPCLFGMQEISPSYQKMGAFVNELLKKRTKQSKHIYRSLVKKGLLFAVTNGEMTGVQYKEVLEILKFHNVKIMDPVIRALCEFKILIEPKGSPEFLVAGDASVCCMSFGSEKARVYAREKGFGIVNIYYRDRIIANSVIWINEPYQCLVLDNIEVHPNYTKFNEILKGCFCTVTEKIMHQFNLRFAVQGEQFNDLMLYEEESQEICFETIKPVEVQTKYFYTDAKRSKVICQNISDMELSAQMEDIRQRQCLKAA